MERLAGPSTINAATVQRRDGRQCLSITRAGERVLAPSPLGLEAVTGADEVAVTDTDLRGRERAFETVTGGRRRHVVIAREKTVGFDADGTRAELDLRVTTDGVAYRIRVPGFGPRMHTAEASAAVVPPDATAWLSPYTPNHEGEYREVAAGDATGEYSHPALFEVDGTSLLVAEAGVDGDYAASRLVGDGEGGFRREFPSTVWVEDDLVTPWRVFVVGGPGTVVESSLLPSLVEGPAIDDGWVEPGRVAWSWWSDGASPGDEARQRDFVDYAAQQGWEYVLVDHGWDPAWLPDLIAYADERDVGVFAWVHWTQLDAETERGERLDRWADWGLAGVKVDFMDGDDQGRVAFYERLLEDAAERDLLVNFHGSVVPTGIRRRWPNALTFEGVRGAEHYKAAGLGAAHNTVLPFTRNAVGPMDYTPVTFSTDERETSAGHELGLAVVFESGLQHFADAPSSYGNHPEAELFLERVPAAWDETRFVGGRPGSEATLARRDGGTWFVGSITAGSPRTVSAPLSFLDGRRTATVVRDASGGAALAREVRTVDADGGLSVGVAENGGWVARLERV